MNNYFERVLRLAILGMSVAGVAFTQSPSIPKAQIVLFTPSDVTPPPPNVYLPRLHEFGEYAEQFFHTELKTWGHEPKRKQFFERGTDGKMTVVHVKGDLKAAGDEYQKEWISRQVLGKLKEDHGVVPAGNLFWIFVYVGDPPAKHGNYRGSGNSKDGGWAVLNYTNLPGKIDLSADIVSKAHDEVFLKGCIHEFGHALGLPHIGPKVELGRGNTLMGPVTRLYVEQKLPHATRAYLSEASAAILSAHPIFTGDATFRNKRPETKFEAISIQYNEAAHGISLTGRLVSNHKVHRIVVIDDRDDKIGAYWVKGYVSRLNEARQFAVSIPRPKACSGKLKVLAVYENGFVTGGGLNQGIGSAKVLPYSFE